MCLFYPPQDTDICTNTVYVTVVNIPWSETLIMFFVLNFISCGKVNVEVLHPTLLFKAQWLLHCITCINVKKLYIFFAEYICLLCVIFQTAVIFLYSIKWLAFIMYSESFLWCRNLIFLYYSNEFNAHKH
jgi:hypothetical protein